MSIKTLIMYAMFAATGALGGCAAGSHLLMRRNSTRLAYLIAYCIMGIAMGLTIATMTMVATGWSPSTLTEHQVNSLLAITIASGAMGSFILGGAHAITRVILKWGGFEVEVVMKKRGSQPQEASQNEGSE